MMAVVVVAAAAIATIVVMAEGNGGWRHQWWAMGDLVRGFLLLFVVVDAGVRIGVVVCHCHRRC